MKKLYKIIIVLCFSVIIFLKPSADSFVFGQARLYIDGASAISIVEHGGTSGTPIYLEVNNRATNAITTSGSDGWIVSESEYNMVKWDIGNNTGSYTVPFGYDSSNGTYAYSLPLTFDVTTGGKENDVGVDTGTVLFSTYHTYADQYSQRPSDVTQMDALTAATGSPSATDDSYYVVDRFWIIDTYNVFNYYTTKPTASITFSYIDIPPNTSVLDRPSEVASPNQTIDGTLEAQRFNTGSSKWDDWIAAGSNTTGNPVGTCTTGSVPAADLFRSWTLSSTTDPLPIQLTQMGVECVNNTAEITWTCATQVNNKSFSVERSPDGNEWEPIATVAGAGNSSVPVSYEATDYSPLSGTSYYRLSQTDYDGQTTYNSPIPFNGCDINGAVISAFYNSQSGNITVRINSSYPDTYNITLLNMLGQAVFTQPNKSLPAGYNEFFIIPPALSGSIYMLNVRSNRVDYTQKMVLGNL